MKRQLKALLIGESEADSHALAGALDQVTCFSFDLKMVLGKEAVAAEFYNEVFDVVFVDCASDRKVVFSLPNLLEAERRSIPMIAIASKDTESFAIDVMNNGYCDYIIMGEWQRLSAVIQRELSVSGKLKFVDGGSYGLRSDTMLRAVRDINRAVLKGDDPLLLVASVCDELVAIGAIRSAWIYVDHGVPGMQRTIQCGWLSPCDSLFERMDEGWLPGCCQSALTSNRIIRTPDPGSSCADFCLSGGYPIDKDVPGEVLTASIRIDDKVYGYMCISVAASSEADEDECFLLKEMADDIAFALRSIELAKEREKMEAALNKEARRRQILMGASRDGICIINQEHQVVEANKRFADMLGYTQNEVLSLYTWDFEAIMKEAQIREAFADLTQTYATFETKHRRKDGSLFDVEVSASGALVGGEPMVFTVSRDITDKKNFQASLVQSDRLASMGVLAAGVAHEINNPLAYVLYNLESLTEDLNSLASEVGRFRYGGEQTDNSEVIEEGKNTTVEYAGIVSFDDILDRFHEALKGGRRIQSITRALGTFSRVEQERLVPVSIHYVIECAINMAFNEIKYRARLVKDFSPLPEVLANEGGLSQVFLNLLINAAHAIPEDAAADNEIRIRTWEEDGEACIEVRDTGEGISEENLQRVFEPFFTTKGAGVGSGLGLAISRNIVKSHGGEIEVKSEIGNGTRILVRLPIVQLDKEKPLRAVKPIVPDVFGRVLIVDDEEGICRAVKRILRGHDVVSARNGEEAKAIIEKDQAFDVILCDMMMPGMSGMDFHSWLEKTYPKLSKLFVFVTGGAFTPKSRDYLKKVDDRCIDKPFDAFRLKQIVTKFISSET